MLYSITPLHVQTLTNHMRKQRIRQHQTKILDNHIFSENISQPSIMSAQKNVKKNKSQPSYIHTHVKGTFQASNQANTRGKTR